MYVQSLAGDNVKLSELREIGDGEGREGFSSNIRLLFDGSVPYLVVNELAIPDSPGLYFIHDLRGCLYIGRTNKLRRRFLQHHRSSHSSSLTLAISNPIGPQVFSWIAARGWTQIELEGHFIRIFSPICNVAKARSN